MTDKPKMNLLGEDGNIFAIMGRASSLLKQNGQYEQASEMIDRVNNSRNYNEALNIVSEYVQTELSPAVSKNEPTKAPRRKPHDR